MFNVPDDQSGGLVQCERCGLLADVPTADDLPNLYEDGTFAFEETEPIDDGIHLAELHRAFTPRTIDDRGREKDLRPMADDFERIGVINDAAPARVAPRYDPFTGELIRALPLKEDQPVPVVAITATPEGRASAPPPTPVVALPYAEGEYRGTVAFKTLPLDLLRPANSVVMAFMFIFYVIAYLAKIPLNTFVIYFQLPMILALLPNVALWAILVHYGCVLEDTGPDASDELPRPLRFFDFGDDLFRPLFRFVLAILICFGPAYAVGILVNAPGSAFSGIVLLLFGIGAFMFPAVLLTSLVGTTVLNISPRRLLGVIQICGGQYPIAVILGLVSFVMTISLLFGPATFPMLAIIPGIQLAQRVLILLPGLLLAIYVTHLFMFQLGLLYRAHHDQFPWLAQRHVKTRR